MTSGDVVLERKIICGCPCTHSTKYHHLSLHIFESSLPRIVPVAPFHMSTTPVYDPTKIWTTLLTNRGYLAGLLVLNHTLRKHGSNYQLVVIISGPVIEDRGFRDVLQAAEIPVKIVETIQPPNEIKKGPWEKLAAFNFTEYEVGPILVSILFCITICQE